MGVWVWQKLVSSQTISAWANSSSSAERPLHRCPELSVERHLGIFRRWQESSFIVHTALGNLQYIILCYGKFHTWVQYCDDGTAKVCTIQSRKVSNFITLCLLQGSSTMKYFLDNCGSSGWILYGMEICLWDPSYPFVQNPKNLLSQSVSLLCPPALKLKRCALLQNSTIDFNDKINSIWKRCFACDLHTNEISHQPPNTPRPLLPKPCKNPQEREIKARNWNQRGSPKVCMLNSIAGWEVTGMDHKLD